MLDGMLDGMLASMHNSGPEYHAKWCSGAVKCRARVVVHAYVLELMGARVRARMISERALACEALGMAAHNH